MKQDQPEEMPLFPAPPQPHEERIGIKKRCHY